MYQRSMMHPFTFVIRAPRLVGGEQEVIAEIECVAAIVSDPDEGLFGWAVETITAEVWEIKPDHKPGDPNAYTSITTVIDEHHMLNQPILDSLYGDCAPDITDAWRQYVSEDHREYDHHAA